MSKEFPAKVLLFGEYSVLGGSHACAFPWPARSGRLKFLETSARDKDLESNAILKAYYGYLAAANHCDRSMEFLDLEPINRDVWDGLFFDSDIPDSYGMGSSGALVAALYDRYRLPGRSADLVCVRDDLAFMESAFHGRSSGTDPLVSYLGKPVFIRGGAISSPDIALEDFSRHLKISLVDSGVPGITKAGMDTFLQEPKPARFRDRYIPLVNDLVDSLYQGNTTGLFGKVLKLSELQLELFSTLFTPAMEAEARRGLDSGEFALKLCGSGGGGFYLKLEPGAR